jgi:hypothetical protein
VRLSTPGERGWDSRNMEEPDLEWLVHSCLCLQFKSFNSIAKAEYSLCEDSVGVIDTVSTKA